MHGHDRPRAFGGSRPDGFRVDVPVRPYIRENRRGADMEDGIDGRAERKGRSDHFIPGSNPQRGKGEVEGGRAGVHRQCVGSANVLPELRLELGGARPGRQPSPSQYGCHGIDLGLAVDGR